jgi:glutamate synthase domain-containing protein 3
LLERHVRYTDRVRAAVLLGRWDEAAAEFRRVVPRTEAAALAGASEGTAAQK